MERDKLFGYKVHIVLIIQLVLVLWLWLSALWWATCLPAPRLQAVMLQAAQIGNIVELIVINIVYCRYRFSLPHGLPRV